MDLVFLWNLFIYVLGACEGVLACSTCHLIFSKKDFDNLRDPLSCEEQDLLDLAYDLTDTLVILF